MFTPLVPHTRSTGSQRPPPCQGLRSSGVGLVLLLVAWIGAAAQVPSIAALPGRQPLMAPEVRAVLGLDPLLQQLNTLQAASQASSLQVLTLRQQILERVLTASFDIDSALGRIDTEASYASEDRYVLQIHNQRQANALNIVTFAASGALGAAGSAMQLTHGLNHAGTALQAASGGTSLVLSGIQLKSAGGKQPIRSPYNMLAEFLDRQPNPESHYPPLVLAYLRAPRSENQASIADGLTAAWRRLHRLKDTPNGEGASVEDLIADRSSGTKLTSDELADREAMLHDLHANIVLLRSSLQQLLASLPPATP